MIRACELAQKFLRKERSAIFGLSDLTEFAFAIFVIFPIVAFIHSLGHSFMAAVLGGRAQFALGRGKKLVQIGAITIHRIYFLDSFVRYDQLKWSNRFTHFMVHAGGVLFNLGSVLLLNYLIHIGVAKDIALFYKFSYFSVWFAFVSLIPIDYGEGSYSDGLSMYYVLKHQEFTQLKD